MGGVVPMAKKKSGQPPERRRPAKVRAGSAAVNASDLRGLRAAWRSKNHVLFLVPGSRCLTACRRGRVSSSSCCSSGPISRADVVFTEPDYHRLTDSVFHWSLSFIVERLRKNTVPFIGLSMSDPNLRRLL